MPGTDGLLHVSEIAHYRVKDVRDELKEGQQVLVKVINIDPTGKIRLSRKALITPEEGGAPPAGIRRRRKAPRPAPQRATAATVRLAAIAIAAPPRPRPAPRTTTESPTKGTLAPSRITASYNHSLRRSSCCIRGPRWLAAARAGAGAKPARVHHRRARITSSLPTGSMSRRTIWSRSRCAAKTVRPVSRSMPIGSSSAPPAAPSITFEFRADQPGTFTFYCNLTTDPGCKDMKGTFGRASRSRRQTAS